MSYQPNQKMDILPLLLVLVALLFIIYYIFPPFRLTYNTVSCYLGAVEAKIFFDNKTFNELMPICRFLSKLTPDQLAKIETDRKASQKLSELYDEVEKLKKKTDIYATILFIPVFILFSYLFYQWGKFAKYMVNEKVDLISFLKEKYNFVIEDKNNVKKVREQMMEYKKKINLPINLIARLYKKDSKERMYIYTNNKNVKFLPLDNIIHLIENKSSNLEKNKNTK